MEDVTHLCSPNSNKEGENVTPDKDGRRTRVPALTGSVEGKRTARRQLPDSGLCHQRPSCTSVRGGLGLFCFFCPQIIFALCCVLQLPLTQQEEAEPGKDRALSPSWVMVTAHSLPSWRVSSGSSIFHTGGHVLQWHKSVWVHAVPSFWRCRILHLNHPAEFTPDEVFLECHH